MFKELKMKIATRRLSRKKAKKSNKTCTSKVLNVIKYPFVLIGRGLKAFWSWVRSIDLIGLVNLTLLSSIIVLFSMLIIDIVESNKKPVVIVAKPSVENVSVSKQNFVKVEHKDAPVALPIKRDSETRKFVAKPVQVVPVKVCETTVKQTARVEKVMYGDVIVDSRGAGKMLNNGDTIKGNLYLQNMRKYVLPCDMHIEGNLFLRDVNMLQFCGDFTVTGNIYVSPKSSFGPLPSTARLGGQVIL